MRGNFESARAMYYQVFKIRRELGNRYGVANILANLGSVEAFGNGNFRKARELLEEALDIFRKLGDRNGAAYVLLHYGRVELADGNHVAAMDQYHQALNIRREQVDLCGEAFVLSKLAEVEREQGNYTIARKLLVKALAIGRELRNQAIKVTILISLGKLEFARGNYCAASDSYDQALGIMQTFKNSIGMAGICALGGAALAMLARHAQAARAIYGALAAAKKLGSELDRNDKKIREAGMARLDAAAASGEISPEELAHWKAEGEAMNVDDLAHFTLAALKEAALVSDN